MKVSIFYSWQSDLSGKTNRYFIEDAIKMSIKEINKDNKIEYPISVIGDTNGDGKANIKDILQLKRKKGATT